ncbi:glycosyltransferase family 4 protein [Cohaesibacter intestini]|uniref:glycosyltransferase family 4 protein n=1 Tax=Cohaesibacter intestini TaxID=2211145 RepID=UPI000DEB122A|nr:glycosyltransferase family 1 protein [Cohaesibacter intestini]
MKVLVATDAWHPQVNGVVRTLSTVGALAAERGIVFDFVSPNDFRTIPLPSYPEIPLALPSKRIIRDRIAAFKPDAIHVATEGSIGFFARSVCIEQGLPFTTSYTTKFPEYIAKRFRVPVSWSYSVLRRFHNRGERVMVATKSLELELQTRGFENLVRWGRGVDTELFTPEDPVALDLPRPIFMSMGRVAIEKNLEAFLSLDLPGSKVVIGKGPDKAFLEKKYPDAHFLGEKVGKELARHLAAADVFVFPSKTDTFGNTQQEALACGVPVAAFPVTGPLDLLEDSGVGALHEDLQQACLAALEIDKSGCRAFALERTWDKSLNQFLDNLAPLAKFVGRPS